LLRDSWFTSANKFGNQAKELLGVKLKNLAEDVYQEGADHVEKLGGHDAVGEYVTIGGAEQGNHLQLLVWENDPSATPKSMIQDAGQLGIPHDVVLRAITKKFPEYAEVLALVS
jgi:hypothetical protein